jgi:hypothetical protein
MAENRLDSTVSHEYNNLVCVVRRIVCMMIRIFLPRKGCLSILARRR